MATVDIVALVALGKAVVEYTVGFDLNPVNLAAWSTDPNGGATVVVVGDQLVLSAPQSLGGAEWASFRVRVLPGAAAEIPIPTGVQAVVSIALNMPAYGAYLRIGDDALNGAEEYLDPTETLIDFPLEGTAREADPDDGVLLMFTPSYNTGTLESFSLSAEVSYTPAFWTNFRGCGESIGSGAGGEGPVVEPAYQITQGFEPGYGTGFQGNDAWADPPFGSYVAPDGYPTLYLCTSYGVSGGLWNGSLWIGVDLESDIVSAVLSDGVHSVDIIAATAVSGSVTDYSVVYGKPGVFWQYNDVPEADFMFDGVSPLTLTVVFAE